MSFLRIFRIALTGLAVLMTGCSAFTNSVDVGPTRTMRPAAQEVVAAPPPQNGAIYSNNSFRPLFENRRARHPGDILTITIAENTSASQRSNSTINRNSTLNGSISALPFMSNPIVNGTVTGNTQNQFQGEGEAGSDSDFEGDITVTVIEVLGNGNLKVAGEKQVGLNGNVDILRFSGVVSPDSISPTNEVTSTQVADARLDFSGRGPVDESQVMGWLSRFFLSFFPI